MSVWSLLGDAALSNGICQGSKNGTEIRAIRDARTNYAWNLQVYTRKPADGVTDVIKILPFGHPTMFGGHQTLHITPNTSSPP